MDRNESIVAHLLFLLSRIINGLNVFDHTAHYNCVNDDITISIGISSSSITIIIITTDSVVSF